MNIYKLNPIENISINNHTVMLTTSYMLCDYMPYGLKEHVTDNKCMKFGAFVYDEDDIENVLNMDRDELTLFELKAVRTTTDPSMMKQVIRFDIIVAPPMIGDKQLEIYNLTSKCILHPRMLIIDDEILICFLVDNIDKTRAKKIKKIMNKENANN